MYLSLSIAVTVACGVICKQVPTPALPLGDEWHAHPKGGTIKHIIA